MSQTKVYREWKHTFYVQYLFGGNRAIYEIMWKNMVELDRPQMTIRRMHSACWIRKSTHTHTHTLRKLFAFPRQQWLRECAPLLRLYVPYLSRFILFRGRGFVFRLHYQIFNLKYLVVFVILYECTMKHMTNASTSFRPQIALLRPDYKTCEFQ
jgi:hypothetical protein